MRGGRWRETLRGFSHASLELLRAEAEALGGDLARSGRRLVGVVVLAVAAAAVLFWAVGALLSFGILLLGRWLPLWGAALAVFGALTLIGLALAGLGWWRLRRIETPAATVRRRAGEHAEWWRRNVSGGRPGGGAAGRRRPPLAASARGADGDDADDDWGDEDDRW